MKSGVRRSWLMSAATLAALAACDLSPDYLKEQNRRRRLEGMGVERFDSAGAFKLAGLSTHREIRIETPSARELKTDTLHSAYRTYATRCGSCHAVPAASSKPAYLWEASVGRMKKNASDAGLMPMSPTQEADVLRFLREMASDRR